VVTITGRIRAVSGSGGRLRYQSVILIVARIIASKFGYRKGRFFDDEGHGRSLLR
jgi:hypothetical protein